MRIRFNTSVFGEKVWFRAGQILTVPRLPPDLAVWLKVLPDGSRRAEILPEDEPECATVAAGPERATLPVAKRRRAR